MNFLSASSELAHRGAKTFHRVDALAQQRSSANLLGGRVSGLVAIAVALFFCSLFSGSAKAQTFGCSPAMANDIVCENSKAGNSSGEWDLNQRGGSDDIVGFATDISVNQGQTISFKINTD